MAKPRSNLYQQVKIPVSDITWAALQKYARKHGITIEDAAHQVVQLALKVIQEEKKPR